MKKSRPGTKVSILSAPDDVDAMLDTLFACSTTIGARLYPVEKRMLPREIRVATTSLGQIKVKIVTRRDGSTRWKAEHDDLLEMARRHGIDHLEAKDRVRQDLHSAFERPADE